MDLTTLESKLNSFGKQPTVSNPFTTNSRTNSRTNSQTNSQTNSRTKPTSITRKINEITNEEVQNYSEKIIPSWNNLQSLYEGQWNKEKEKFQTHLKANFAALVERFASGKQELFQLCAPERREKLYIEAFLELFESGYAPHVGDVERIANKRVRKLFITLPNNYSSIY